MPKVYEKVADLAQAEGLELSEEGLESAHRVPSENQPAEAALFGLQLKLEQQTLQADSRARIDDLVRGVSDNNTDYSILKGVKTLARLIDKGDDLTTREKDSLFGLADQLEEGLQDQVIIAEIISLQDKYSIDFDRENFEQSLDPAIINEILTTGDYAKLKRTLVNYLMLKQFFSEHLRPVLKELLKKLNQKMIRNADTTYHIILGQPGTDEPPVTIRAVAHDEIQEEITYPFLTVK